MLDKLKLIQDRFNELSELLIQPEIIYDQPRYIKLSKEYKDLKSIVDMKLIYEEVLSNVKEGKKLLKMKMTKK